MAERGCRMAAVVLRVLLSALGRCATWRPLLRDRRGAVWVYVALTAAVMFGTVGLALDLGRFGIENTQAQDAADAAALAAASQLDGQAGAIARATKAAQTAPLVTNKQALSSAGAGTVTIASLTFYTQLPADDNTAMPTSGATVTTDDTKARFVMVTTQQLPHQNWFLPVVGASANAKTDATAVAGNTKVVCKISPLLVCNPAEAGGNTGAPFDITVWQGKQVLLKGSQNGSQWQPGDFGLQAPQSCGNGAQCVANVLASLNPGSECTPPVANPKPGQTQGMRESLNTRFDMWQNPYFGSNAAMKNANFAPAVDVTKGMTVNNQCNQWTQLTPAGSPAGEGIPRDSCFAAGTCTNSNRFGDGKWDCATYWRVNHPGVLKPSWCTSTADATANFPNQTRFAMYQNEISNSQIPNNSKVPPPNGPGENGNPTCAPAPAPDGANRRILYFAVIDCVQNNFTGKSNTAIPVEAFAKGFLTEPVSNPPTPNIYMEIVGVAQPGDGVLHDVVQLYR